MPVQFEDSTIRIIKVAHMGPVDNNGYILSCRRTGEAVIIDAPAEPEKLLGEIGDAKVKAIIITHRHGDHTAGLGEVKEHTGAPTGAHPEDVSAIPGQTEFQLKDGDTYQVGEVQLKALHTPGHTPGGICLVAGNHVFSGTRFFQVVPAPHALLRISGRWWIAYIRSCCHWPMRPPYIRGMGTTLRSAVPGRRSRPSIPDLTLMTFAATYSGSTAET